MNKKSIITIFIFILLLFFIVLIIYTYKNYSIPFNHDKWVASNHLDEYSVRKYMARYLISKQLLMGKSIDEIDQLLGQTSIKQDDNNTVYYEIREKYGYDIDPVAIDVIVVYLDQEGKAVKPDSAQ